MDKGIFSNIPVGGTIAPEIFKSFASILSPPEPSRESERAAGQVSRLGELAR